MAADHGQITTLRGQVELEVAAYAHEDELVGQLVRGLKLDELVRHVEPCMRILQEEEIVGNPVMLLREIVRSTCARWVLEDNEERLLAECEKAGLDRSSLGSAGVDENPGDDAAANTWQEDRKRAVELERRYWSRMRSGRA